LKKDLLIAYLALAAICVIWGTTYLALRIAVVDFPPFLFVAIRQLLAGAILVTFMLTVGKASLKPSPYLFHQAVAGFFMISLGNGLVAWAEVHIPSGVAAVICSIMPVMVILINLTISQDEKPTVPIMMGVAIGMVGIILIFSEHMADFGKVEYIVGIILTFVAVISSAGASLWLKKHSGNTNPFLNAGLQMFFGGFWLLPASLTFDNLHYIRWTSEILYSMIYLVIFGSIIAYACYSYALRKLPMTIVSLYAYVNPIVAVVLGWLILDEKLNTKIGVAIVLTVAGIYIVNRGYQLRDAWKAQFTR
jgi:drug/metabolite transporter (DMT)-like permease